MPQQQAAPSPIAYIFLYLPIFLIIYFILIRPQRQNEKERQKLLSALSKNDEVVTNSGIHGTVANVKEKTVILRIDENVKIEIDKSCIAHVQNKGQENK